jgi:carboxypeptidase C (cathepsin A)
MQPWFVGEKKMGEVRNVGPVTFLRVFEAGHMVPLDQPEVRFFSFSLFFFSHLALMVWLVHG